MHQNGLTCKEIAAKNFAPERIIPDHQELQELRFGCSEEGFRTSQSVQQVPGTSPPEESTREFCPHQCRTAQHWQQEGVGASAHTARPRRLDNDLVSRRAAKKPLLSNKNIKRWTEIPAVSTIIGQQKTGAKLLYLMKNHSDCLEHLEYRLSREEKVNATMSPVSCQQ